MKTYKEMADDALNRISQYEAEKQNKRKKISKLVVPTLSLCIVAVVCIGMFQSGTLNDRTKLATTDDINNGGKTQTAEEIEAQNQQEKQLEKELENNNQISGQTPKPDNQVILSDDEDAKGSGESTSGFAQFWWKNKIVMYGDLYWALGENPNGTFAVTAKYRPTPQDVTDFTHEGKTLFELAVAADNERMMLEKMAELLKVGDELKYGEALYTTGGPNGIKWTQELYEEKLAYFGEELINKYIVNGEFLADTLKKDIEEHNETSAARTYKLAYNAYLETVLSETEKILSENNIKCERAPYQIDSLNIVVTADELEYLPLENVEFWVFGLTNNDLKGSQPTAE